MIICHLSQSIKITPYNHSLENVENSLAKPLSTSIHFINIDSTECIEIDTCGELATGCKLTLDLSQDFTQA